jgi:hypothetical protein
MRRRAFYLAVFLVGFSLASGQVPTAGSEEAELAYCKIWLHNGQSGCLTQSVHRWYASGSVNAVIESVAVGTVVSCQAGTRRFQESSAL